jgi:multicomponent Na+:H+ antiporter subunit C
MSLLQTDLALLIGMMFAAGTYLVLQNSFVKVLFGFSLLAHGANLVIIAMAGSPWAKEAPIVDGLAGLTVDRVDPLPQALVLTAIVIGFAITAYLTVLLYRLFLDYRTTRIRSIYAEDRERERQERASVRQARERT